MRLDVSDFRGYFAACIVIFAIFLSALLAFISGTFRYYQIDALSEQHIDFLIKLTDHRTASVLYDSGSETEVSATLEDYRRFVIEDCLRGSEVPTEIAVVLENYIESSSLLFTREFMRIDDALVLNADNIELISKTELLHSKIALLVNALIESKQDKIVHHIRSITILLLCSLCGCVFLFSYVIRTFYSDVIRPIKQASTLLKKEEVTAVGKISSRNRHCQRLLNAIVELYRISEHEVEQKSRFVSIVSHELRTPLNSIVLNVEMLIEDVDGHFGPANEPLKEIQYSSTFLLQLCNHILKSAKPIVSDDVVFEVFDLATSIDVILSLIRRTLEFNGIKLYVYVDPQFPKYVSSSLTYFNQIITNLLTNAIYHSNTKILRVRFLVEGKLLKVTVVDFGVGIESQSVDNKEQRFRNSYHELTGSGLGLSLAYKFAEVIQGQLTYTSRVGSGTRFVLRFPGFPQNEKLLGCFMDSFKLADESTLSPVTPQEQKYINYHCRNNALLYKPTTQAIVSPLSVFERRDNCFAETIKESTQLVSTKKAVHILVVDDFTLNLSVMGRLLDNLGWQYSLAASADEALKLLENSEFDLILMDIQMPIVNGIEAANIIKKELQISVPIIGLTANIDANVYDKCIDAGMVSVYTKPLRKNELISVITQYVNVH